MLTTIHFKIGHVALSVHSGSTAILARIATWLADFVLPAAPEPGAGEIALTLNGYQPGDPVAAMVPVGARLTFTNSTARYYEHDSLWFVDFGELGLVVVNRAESQMTGHVRQDLFLTSEVQFEDFMHPLYELMRQCGLYPHHAAAISHGDHAVLLVGKSGQGKSTLAVDSIHHGFDFLCDDRCFVRTDHGRLEVLSFYEPFKVFPANVGHLPDVSELVRRSPAATAKAPCDIRGLYPHQSKRSGSLSRIVFPQWAPREQSRLEPVTPGQALIDLLPLTMVCFDNRSASAHFDFAGQMVSRVPAARLYLGGDRENWHRLVLDFLK